MSEILGISGRELRILRQTDDEITIRTNCGERVARRVAEFELDSEELHVSVIMDVSSPPIKLARGEKPSVVESQDYVFSTKLGRTPMSEGLIIQPQQAMKRSRVDMRQHNRRALAEKLAERRLLRMTGER